MTLVYEQSGKFKGVPTYRFVAPKTLFANGTDYPPNEGFCPCMQSGIQNVSTCRLSKSSPPWLSFAGQTLNSRCNTSLAVWKISSSVCWDAEKYCWALRALPQASQQ